MLSNNQPADFIARQQAVDVSKSFVVSAPAGSGKTGLLTLRVLKLLGQVKQPEEILCITFTKKAAHEMHERIFGALTQAQENKVQSNYRSTLSEYEQETFDAACAAIENAEKHDWQLLNTPYRLNISTIDGFCKTLCNQLPYFSGLGADAGVLENTESEFLLVAERWLRKALEDENHSAVQTLVKHLSGDVNKIIRLLAKMLSVRDQWLPLVIASYHEPSKIRQVFEYNLLEWLKTGVSSVLPYLKPYEAELCDLIKYASDNNDGGRNSELINTLAEQAEFPAIKHGCENYWRAFSKFCLSTSKTYRKKLDKSLGFPAGNNAEEKRAAKEKKQQLLAIFSELQEAGLSDTLLYNLQVLPNTHYPEEQWLALSALVETLPLIAAELKIHFASLGKADFSEFSLGAVSALDETIGEMELIQRFDYRIQHILIDEFQDTSQVQLNLLKALTQGWSSDDGRSLFLVGDGMQSCYSFRNANVGIFLNLREYGLENINTKAIDLNVNFRSTENIVQWVNTVFDPAFPQENEANLGAVKYIPSSAFKPLSENSAVKCLAFEKGSDTDAESRYICNEIERIRRDHPSETIAVLAKSRAHLLHTISEMKQRGIPFEAIDIDALSSKQHISDIAVLTRLIFDPSHMPSWLALLRSPFCGLNHKDLYTIFKVFKSQPQHLLLSDLKISHKLAFDVDGETLILSREGSVRFSRVLPALRTAIESRGRRQLAQQLESLWLQLGGAESLDSEAALSDINTYIELLQSYSNQTRTLNWKEFEVLLKNLYASTETKPNNPVQVMTMHKSKGLEFDTVFLPNLNKGRRPPDTELLYWMERINTKQESQFVLSPVTANTTSSSDPITEFIKSQRAVKSSFEDTRVFYVACTRAKQRLYLSGAFDRDENNAFLAPLKASLFAKIWPTIEPALIDGDEILSYTSVNSKSLETTALQSFSNNDFNIDVQESLSGHAHTLKAFPQDWQPEVLTSLNKHSDNSKPFFDNKNEELISQHVENDTARVFGVVFHRILKIYCEKYNGKMTASDITLHRPFWVEQLRNEGLSKSEITTSLDTIEHTLTKLNQDPEANWIFGNHYPFNQCEWSIRTRAASSKHRKFKEHILDRVFIDDGRYWIIDYKSSSPSAGQALDDFISHESSSYHEQLQRYQEVLIQYHNHLKSHNVDAIYDASKIHVALYFPLIQHLEHIKTLGLEL